MQKKKRAAALWSTWHTFDTVFYPEAFLEVIQSLPCQCFVWLSGFNQIFCLLYFPTFYFYLMSIKGNPMKFKKVCYLMNRFCLFIYTVCQRLYSELWSAWKVFESVACELLVCCVQIIKKEWKTTSLVYDSIKIV